MHHRSNGIWVLLLVLALLVPGGCAKGPDQQSADTLMQQGLDAHYARHDLPAAVEAFRKVLQLNPQHYGATYQLAYALDQLQQQSEATPYWQKMLAMAEASGDTATADTARARLGQVGQGKSAQDADMNAGLDALYTKHDAPAAVAAFRKVLEAKPGHYGASFQLAMAFEQAGKKDEARAQWELVLKLADAAGDKPIADTARARLTATP